MITNTVIDYKCIRRASSRLEVNSEVIIAADGSSVTIVVLYPFQVDSRAALDFMFCLNICYHYWPMTENKLRVYIKPTCTTCRKALAILREEGADFEAINYYEKPFSKKGLTELIKKLNIAPRDLLRKNEGIYKELGLSRRDLSDSEIMNLMIKHPDLIQRPIVDGKGKVILARPAEEIKRILSK